MSVIEIIAYLVLGFFIYQIGSFILFYRLCKRVIGDFEGTSNLPDTDNVKELIGIVGKEQVEDLYERYKDYNNE